MKLKNIQDVEECPHCGSNFGYFQKTFAKGWIVDNTLFERESNGEIEKQKLYPSIGIMFSRELTERYSVIGSYDSTNALTFGIGYKF